MTSTRIQDTLLDVRDAVEVPPIDEVAFRQHVRRARRGRLAGRAVVAAAAVAALAVGPAVWMSRPAGSPPDTTRLPGPAAASAPRMFAVSLEGRLELVLPDGSSYSTHQRVEEVLGSGPAGVVVVDRDSHVLRVPVMPSGQPGRPEDVADGRPVQRAWLDKSGQYVGYVDLDDRLHLRAVGSSTDVASSSLSPGDAFLGLDGSHWLTEDSGAVTLGSPTGGIVIASGDPAASAQLAGPTVAYVTTDGVDFHDSSDGRERASASGLGVGSLSPDGRWYAGAPGETQTDAGAAPGLSLVDTRTGEAQQFPGPSRAHALAVTWQDDDRFLVLGTDSRQRGNRLVWDCSVALRQCVERVNDPGGTLEIASR